MTSRAVLVRAGFPLAGSPGGHVLVLSWAAGRGPVAGDGPWPGWLASEHVAASGPCADGRHDIADLIFLTSAAPAAVIAARLAGLMDRYPGCAVAAGMTGAGQCMVAAHSGMVVLAGVRTSPGASRMLALACGSLAHAWVSAGRPLATLGRLRLGVAVWPPGGGDRPGHGGAWSCSVREAGDPAAVC
jgi:hypothetical protein